jgi:hypothetical protein
MAPLLLDPVAPVAAPEMPSDGVSLGSDSAPQQLEMPDPVDDAPSSDEVLGFGEEELVGGAMPDPIAAEAPNAVVEAEEIPALLEEPVLDVERPPEPAVVESAGQTSLFDFGLTDDLGLSDRSLAVAQVGSVGQAPADAGDRAPEALHAGLIVERGGNVERVVAWDAPELILGRAPECELVLGGSGVSRRHAELRFEGGTHTVRDLGSANGIYVNGSRVEQVDLEQGDVVRIDDFTLTFVLDREPVAQAVHGSVGSAQRRVASEAAHPIASAAAGSVPMPERDLVLAEDADLEAIAADKQLEASASEVGSANESQEPLVWAFEVAIATERLPEEMRRALEGMDAAELVLPAQLRLVRRNPA